MQRDLDELLDALRAPGSPAELGDEERHLDSMRQASTSVPPTGWRALRRRPRSSPFA